MVVFPMVSLPRFLLGVSLLSLAALTSACGSNYETTKVKEYKLALVQGESYFKDEFRALVQAFNARAGMNVLSFVDSADDANSSIILTKGLKASSPNNEVGFGQWLSESKSDNPFTTTPGRSPQRTVTYSMRLQFDWDYFNDARGNEDPKDVYKKQKLFFHEVGHGLEMDHDEGEEHSVMYPDVGKGDQKDFGSFFERVRSYMNDTGD